MNNSKLFTLLFPDRMLESNKDKGVLDINCCDPLGRSALLMAIDNENLEIIELLLDNKVRTRILHSRHLTKKGCF